MPIDGSATFIFPGSTLHPASAALAPIAQQVAGWLQPLGDPGSGQNLEYEIEFLEFTQAAEGRPETQFSAAEPPSWPDVQSQAETLFDRTRDLRIAVPWARALINLHGFIALPEALRLLHGLLDGLWDSLYPELDPDDGDPFSRVALMATLGAHDGLLGDLRNAPLLQDRRLSSLRVRDVEVALGHQPARGDQDALSAGQVQGMLAEHADASEAIRQAVIDGQSHLNALVKLMNERFGIERAPDSKPLRSLIKDLESLLPPPPVADSETDTDGAETEVAGDEPGAVEGPKARRPSTAWQVSSRDDATRAIQLVCDYLERYEPTNPALFLLQRAQRVFGMNFLRVVRELAPEAVAEVARIMGVDPDTVRSED